MANDENDKYEDVSDLLKKFYKPKNEISNNEFWDELSKKLDSLFHKEILSDRISDEKESILTEEERYWMGLEEYLNNQVQSLKHKAITDHLLKCKECRKNYNDLLDKKKVLNYSFRTYSTGAILLT
jgi:type I site-specific restriction-modification system R (restriction) subunit